MLFRSFLKSLHKLFVLKITSISFISLSLIHILWAEPHHADVSLFCEDRSWQNDFSNSRSRITAWIARFLLERLWLSLIHILTIPQITVNQEKFNTVNLQQEIAKGMQQIMEAKGKNEVDVYKRQTLNSYNVNLNPRK